MRKSRRLGRIFGVLLLLAAALGAILLALRPDWRYLAGDALTRWTHSAQWEEVDPSSLTLTEYTLDQLRELPGVEENRNLMLINPAYPLSEDFQPQLTSVPNSSAQMDTAALEAYQALSEQLLAQFRETMLIRSAYRSRAEQVETIAQDGDVAAGLDASEHQAGLAVDVAVPGYGGRALLKTAAGQYLNDNCWQYGFLIRYPYYGTGDTGIPYEPWHLRYVGVPHAQIMMENSWTLEEYFRRLEQGRFYQSGGTLITRQQEQPFQLPEHWERLSLSPDNQGGWVFTVTVQ